MDNTAHCYHTGLRDGIKRTPADRRIFESYGSRWGLRSTAVRLMDDAEWEAYLAGHQAGTQTADVKAEAV
jgi:hypothetical protein